MPAMKRQNPSAQTLVHTLGFPRMGAQRELKFALEKHWRGETDRPELEATAAELRARHWQAQRVAKQVQVEVDQDGALVEQGRAVV